MRKVINKKGFTFLEMIVAMFIFVLVMVTVTNIFGRALTSFSKTRNLQKDLENAQYAMNSMTKIIRASAIVTITGCLAPSCLRVYDYSQYKCIEYFFDADNSLKMRTAADPSPNDTTHPDRLNWFCRGDSGSDPLGVTTNRISMTTGTVSGAFYVTYSVGTYGKATTRIDISTPKDTVRIQSSVSLRNKTH